MGGGDRAAGSDPTGPIPPRPRPRSDPTSTGLTQLPSHPGSGSDTTGPTPTSRRALWAALAGSLLAFAALALAYDHEPLATIDAEALAWASTDMPTLLEWVARPFSWIGGWIGLTALGVVAAVVLVRERAWLDLGFFLAAFLGMQLAVALLKAGFDRARPDVGSAVALPGSPAFPSGHAAAGAASFGALAILLAERLPRAERTWLWAGVVALGVAIGLSRVALSVHFVTDVLAGWCLGLAWLAACLLARDRLRSRTGEV